MMRHFFSAKREVIVDECPKCAGTWLDYGELRKIRKQFGSQAEREKAAKEFFSELFDDELSNIQAEGAEKTASAKRVARLFRFICPSYYLPGKQDWGAF